MKIVFDLDYTLLDTIAFKKALVDATGVDEKEWQSSYDEAVKANKGLFEPSAFFSELKQRKLLTDESEEASRRRFDDVLKTTEQYLYPQAKELLEALGKHEVEVDLMTFGQADWQRAKVEHSGLTRLFNKVLYVESDKKGFVKGLGEGQDKVLVVNDNGKEMDEMVEAAPEHTYVLKTGGPKAPPKDWKHLKAESIEDLAEVLEKQTGWELRREMREAREGVEGKMVASGENVRVEIEMGDEESEEKSDVPPFDPSKGGSRL